jgi:thiamine-monophosphate kinase
MTSTARESSTGIAERSLIESIAAELSGGVVGGESRIVRGIGDDAAVVRARPACVTSVDAMIEGVHFRLDDGWATPSEVGHRALAGALSDLAAMGADAGEAYLMLGLPTSFGERGALELVRAAGELARRTGTAIVGGDVVGASALTVCVTAVGWADRPEDLVGRDGARAGDLVGVTGRLGCAGAARAVMAGRTRETPAAQDAVAVARRPMPRLGEGRALAAAGAHAMIDLSDGLATDAAHIGRSSGVCLRVRLPDLPLGVGVVEVSAELGVPPWRLAATGGEDYELCFCAAPEDRVTVENAVGGLGEVEVTWVGEVCEGPAGAALSDEHGGTVLLEGFEHAV